ncbi:DUF6498-containing protein [Nocardioides solisilvae]|uniref:DUF6498-containing protein n=1 Tax=Nocardioides solisilvae TaxID=1542435 RepID=UPI000D747E45|nr:DUF6498-containing protein [Nocardioides solisilvae]
MVVNLLPLAGVAAGWLSLGDVFVVYWMENVAVWLVTVVKVATSRAPEPTDSSLTLNGRPAHLVPRAALAGFFALHYGIFTLVHGAFAFVMAFVADGELHARYWFLTGLAFVVSHLVSLAVNWFGEDERSEVPASRAMWQPYPRMLVLHVAILGGFGLVLKDQAGSAFPDPSAAAPLLPVALLCGLKTVVDLWFHLRERRRAREAPPSPGPVAGAAE